MSHKSKSRSENLASSSSRKNKVLKRKTSNSSKKNTQIKLSENSSHEEVKEENESISYPQHEKSENVVADSPHEKIKVKVNTSSKNEVVEKEKKEKKEKRHNWRYWLSIAFLPIGAILLIGSLIALIINFWLLVALVAVFLSLMIFGIIINLKNMKLTKGDKDQVLLRHSSIIFVILFSLLFVAILVLFFVLGLDSF